MIDGNLYKGGRAPSDFVRAICKNLKGHPPVACRQLPEPVAVTLIVITDKRCGKACDTREVELGLTTRYLPKLTVKRLDYGSEAGRALFRRLGLKKLPALVFLPGVEKAEKYSFLARFMLPRPDGHRQLLIPAKWDPKAEICDNKKDDTGNGKVDCDDPTCHEKLLCRKEKKRVIHAFVMSQCPYGLMAVLAMREVLDTFKDRVTFDLHFIADRKADGTFESLHGAPEVAEDIRQLCAKKHYLKKNRYLDYVWCRSKDANSTDWKICAKGAIKAKVIDTCATGPEGAKLLAEDIKLSKALGFSASPTLLANNVHKFHAISAEDIKKGICK
ncbi:MAG: hypothetical protein KAI47_28115, partial [Deltaproteobacteria bacterium]|nr:hypothetical protein [Deltaproteobacteria bacterium]